MSSSFSQKIISPALAGGAAALTVISLFPHIHYFSFLVGLISYIFFLWLAQMIVDVIGPLAGGRVGRGALYGLLFSFIILIVAKSFSKFKVTDGLQDIANFFVAAPIFLLGGIRNASDIVAFISYVLYCAIIGGLLGWIYSLKKPTAFIGIVFFMIGLAVVHYYTLVQIEKSLSAALSAFVQFLSGEALLEGK